MKAKALNYSIYVLQALTISMILAVGFDLYKTDFRIPITSEGDALHYLAVARSILDGGNWWHIQRLSAPYELPMVMFPFCGISEFGLLKGLSLFLHDPGSLVNAVYFISFLITGASAFWCLHRLQFSRLTSFTVSILYAFLPFAIYRNIAHLMLVYYFVPFVTTSAILIFSGELATLSRRQKIILYTGTLLVGLNYIYTAFFGCFLLSIAGLGALHRTRRLRSLITPAILVISISCISLINIIPSYLSWQQDPEGAAMLVGTKNAAEADLLGLKLRHLITPRLGHPIPAFHNFAEHTLGKFPLDNENTTAALGAVGTIGLFLLLGVTIFNASNTKHISPPVILTASASLIAAAFLLATIGGFGSIFNFLVTPEIRAYNRISVFIAFLALAGSAYLLNALHSKIGDWWAIALNILILTLGLWDQCSFAHIAKLHKDSESRYRNTEAFVSTLESTLPSGSMIYQLPYTPYPNTPPIASMTAHSHLLPYITSHSLRWSWPALSGRSVAFNTRITESPPHALITNLLLFGFEGIWINRSGYSDHGTAILREIEEGTHTAPITSPTGEFAFIDLRSARSSREKRFGSPGNLYTDPSQLANIDFGESIQFSTSGTSAYYITHGWSGGDPTFRWTEGSVAELRFNFPLPPQEDVVLTAKAFALTSEKSPSMQVKILANGRAVGAWNFHYGTTAEVYTCVIPHDHFHGSAQLTLALQIDHPVSPKSLDINGDERLLGVGLCELRFDLVTQSSSTR